MPGDNTPSPTHKAYAITNIRTYVPLVLDLTTRNYDPWSDLFSAHCRAYDVLDHIDATYDAPKTPPTDPEWEKLDGMVKLWLFGSISQSLISSAYSSKASARKVWLNINSIFCENTESTAMQLESELRTIAMGDLSVHDYYDKVKKLADLLEGLGEKVKDKHIVIHAINGLSTKFDGIARIIRHQKPFPTFAEMRSMLAAEEQRLTTTRVTTPTHDSHTSAPSLLHVSNSITSNNNRGAAGNSYRRNDRGGGGNYQRGGGGRNSNRGRRQFNFSSGAGGSMGNQRFGWVFIPPPIPTNNWSPPTNNFNTHQPIIPFQQQCYSTQQWSRPPHTNHGPQDHKQPHAQQQAHAYHQSTSLDQPPWAWLGSADQPTSLPTMFNSMSLNDPGNSGWVMDTGATDHVHANAYSSPSHPL